LPGELRTLGLEWICLRLLFLTCISLPHGLSNYPPPYTHTARCFHAPTWSTEVETVRFGLD
jgi:hypothetical protein